MNDVMAETKEKNLQKGWLKWLFLLSVLVMGIGLLFSRSGCEASVKSEKKVGDSVYLGSYPRTEIKGKKLTKAIKNAKYDEDGFAKVKGVIYKRISKKDARYIGSGSKFYKWDNQYHYFQCEPIKWNIIGKKNGNYILISEEILDTQQYHNKLEAVSWSESVMRTWLNRDFYNTAFSAAERKLLQKTEVSTPRNTVYGTSGGTAVKDKVYLLSVQEAAKKAFGFSGNNSRKAKTTDYAHAMGALTRKTGMGCWWPRTAGKNSKYAANILSSGKVSHRGYKVTIFDGVRPVIQIKAES